MIPLTPGTSSEWLPPDVRQNVACMGVSSVIVVGVPWRFIGRSGNLRDRLVHAAVIDTITIFMLQPFPLVTSR